ncbi:unnamed protein product [Calypogeia fissa]
MECNRDEAMLQVLEVLIVAQTKLWGTTMDWYGILKVDPSADDSTIRQQYKKLALVLHPDKNKAVGAEHAFKLIGEAHCILLYKQNRADHDKARGLEGETFCSACLNCKKLYRYERKYENQLTKCTECGHNFVIHDINGKPAADGTPGNEYEAAANETAGNDGYEEDEEHEEDEEYEAAANETPGNDGYEEDEEDEEDEEYEAAANETPGNDGYEEDEEYEEDEGYEENQENDEKTEEKEDKSWRDEWEEWLRMEQERLKAREAKVKEAEDLIKAREAKSKEQEDHIKAREAKLKEREYRTDGGDREEGTEEAGDTEETEEFGRTDGRLSFYWSIANCQI